MKKLIIVLMFSTMCFGQAVQWTDDEQKIDIMDIVNGDFVGGEYNPDGFSYNKIPKGYVKAIFNMRNDQGSLKRKKGVRLIDTLSTGQPIRYGFEYAQNDGDRYMILVSSKQIYAHAGDFEETEITTCTATGNWTAQVVNDTLYMYSDQSSDDVLSYDGTTLTRYEKYSALPSTNGHRPNIQYSAKWNEVIFGAGDPNAPSYLYRCYVDTRGVTYPLEWDTYDGIQYIDYVGADSGQKIEGLVVFNGNLYIFMERSTYMQYGIIPVQNMVQISDRIGCLDGHGIYELDGKLIVPSHRGLEEFDGYTFKLRTRANQAKVDEIQQLQGDRYRYYWQQTTAVDWGAGSSVLIDTDTYSGSVYLSTTTIDQSSVVDTTSSGLTNHLAQSFEPQYNNKLSQVAVKLGRKVGTPPTYTINISSVSFSGTSVSTGTIDGTTVTASTTEEWYVIDMSPDIDILNTVTYFLKINNSGSDTLNRIEWVLDSIGTSYSGGAAYYSLTNYYYDASPAALGTSDFAFKQYSWGSSTHTSQVYNLGSIGFNFWSTFEANDTTPGNSSISYAIATSTSGTDNWSAYTDLTSGSDVSVTTAPYVRIRSFYYTDVSTSIPSTQDYRISWYKDEQNENLVSLVFKDRGYTGYTSLDSNVNDSVWIIGKNGAFVSDTGAYGCLFRYRDRAFAGSSADDGNLFELEVTGVYTDSGTATTAYIETGDMDYGYPSQRKTYDEFWVVLDEITNGTLTVSYYIDGADTATASWTVDMDAKDNYVYEGIPFPIGKSGYNIRYRLSSTDNFSIRRIETVYRLWNRLK